MPITAYKDLNWGPGELTSTDKLNLMVANSRYLFERAPKLYYNAYNVQKDTGIKIACGVATFPASKSTVQTVNVEFGSFFTTGCKPVITHGIVSSVNGRLIPSMYGISGPATVPDRRGFTARIAATEMLTPNQNYFVKTVYLHWIAVGY